MRVLGVDPGYDRMGLAIVEGPREKPVLLYSSCVETSRSDDFSDRLGTVCDGLRETIAHWKPDVVALEQIFFSKNQKTALQVAEARGAILVVARDAGLRSVEYNPSAIKIAVTGEGRADKTQVLTMLSKLIKIPPRNRHDDEYDAIAVALTHLAEAGYPQRR